MEREYRKNFDGICVFVSPGIPIIVPGEQITEDVIAYLEMYEQLGFSIEGLEVDKQIKVWINE